MTLICPEPIQTAGTNPARATRAVERGRSRSRARHAQRARYTRRYTRHTRSGNVWAALSLAVLTPMIAEVTLGTTPLAMAWMLLVYLPIYGAGVLLLRELVRRTGGGWGSVLLLGVAYGLVIEGIVLQSLTIPAVDGAVDWAPRVLGVNAAYAELTLVYHAVFSVAIPIALVELLFTRHGRAPYLNQAGMVRCGVAALFGVALLRILMSPDPGGVAPPAVLLTFTAIAGTLGVLALLVLPNLTNHRLMNHRLMIHCQPSLTGQFSRTSGQHGATALAAAPRPGVTAAFCGTTTLVFLSLLFPIGATRQAAFIDGFWEVTAMLSAALLVLITALVVHRHSAAPGWTDRHRLAVITGPLIAHTVFGAVAVTHTLIDTVALVALGVVMVAALTALDRRLRVRRGPAARRIPDSHIVAPHRA